MRVSNNNQTTFGMNPAIDLTKASERLAKLVDIRRHAIVSIGNNVSVCRLEDFFDGVKATVHVIKDDKTYKGSSIGSLEKIVDVVEQANSGLTQKLADIFLGVETKVETKV